VTKNFYFGGETHEKQFDTVVTFTWIDDLLKWPKSANIASAPGFDHKHSVIYSYVQISSNMNRGKIQFLRNLKLCNRM
jgi:hypothetical protein